jgi:hypothetical protein
MGRVALKTLHLYLTMICSIYIDHILLVTVFENILLYYILDGVTSLNLNLKEATPKLLILYSILAKIITSSNLILRVNTNTAFCFAFIGYLYIGEISYTNKQRFKLLFTATKVTRLNV